MSTIQFLQTTPEQLQQGILNEVKAHLDAFLQNFTPKPPNQYLTRSEVAAMFQVDLSTIHNWCKSGKLKPLGFGGRVYFRQSDIEESLIVLND